MVYFVSVQGTIYHSGEAKEKGAIAYTVSVVMMKKSMNDVHGWLTLPFSQSRRPAREWYNPQWMGLPTSMNLR